jgi:protein-tyrosine phosphatase
MKIESCSSDADTSISSKSPIKIINIEDCQEEKMEKTEIRCCICEFVVLSKIGMCEDCHNYLKLSRITDTLYLTNFRNAQNYDMLKEFGIRQILVVGNEMTHHTEDFRVKYISIDDCPMANMMIHFEEAHEFIKQDITVVHCFAGISRSATIVISYLMKHYGMSLSEALRYCREKRCIVCPNQGFLQQLQKYDRILYNSRQSLEDILEETVGPTASSSF